MRKQAFSGGFVGGLVTVAITLAIFSPFATYSQNTGKQFIKNSQPSAVPHLTAIGRLAEETRLNLSVGLPLRNESDLDALLGQLYDPASPNYHHYLTTQQFTDQFGPTESDYQSVENFFRTNGFTIASEYPNRVVLDVSGSVGDIERVFHVAMRTYNHPTEGRTFFAPDVAPSIDLNVPVQHISGLDNYSVFRPRLSKKAILNKATYIPHTTGSGPSGTYMGRDFRNAYLPGVSLTGAGQTLGLLELDGYYTNDINAYTNIAGFVGVPLVNVPVSGGISSPGSGNGEVALDIEVAMAIAPGLSKIVVYEAPNTPSLDTILSAMANDHVNSPQVFSCSWGASTPGPVDTTQENLFKQMDAQGQSFYDATGDGNAFVGGVPSPSESTNITQVGATTLTTTGPNGAYVLETTWNWGYYNNGGYTGGSSGGVSSNFAMPYWQQGMSWTSNLGNTTNRNVPDVAMVGDNVFIVADSGSEEVVGGTSCAAPEWAAVTALANQQAAAKGHAAAGFVNPVLYAAGKSASYTSDFDDITLGNNFWSSSTNLYPAVQGFDLCTGWGSPSGDNLIDLLAGVSDSLSVSPGRGFVSFGPAGGPFTSSSTTFILFYGVGPLNWSLINTSAWLTASATSGTVPATGTNVTVSLNATAYNLPIGTYTASLVFSNATSHAVRTRQFTLLVAQSSLQNGDFEYAALSSPYWAQTGVASTFNTTFVDDGSALLGISPFGGGNYAAFHSSGAFGNLAQTIATVPGQSYQLSFWVVNPSGATKTRKEQFFAYWINAATNTLLNLTNPPAFTWTNYIFDVTATGTNSMVQFSGRNDAAAFGLDDVSLIPIPSPNILNVSRIGKTALSLTWNSQTNSIYQVQYSTNLLSTNWLNLNTNTAAGPVLTVTNSIGPDRYRFYRVLRLP